MVSLLRRPQLASSPTRRCSSGANDPLEARRVLAQRARDLKSRLEKFESFLRLQEGDTGALPYNNEDFAVMRETFTILETAAAPLLPPLEPTDSTHNSHESIGADHQDPSMSVSDTFSNANAISPPTESEFRQLKNDIVTLEKQLNKLKNDNAQQATTISQLQTDNIEQRALIYQQATAISQLQEDNAQLLIRSAEDSIDTAALEIISGIQDVNSELQLETAKIITDLNLSGPLSVLRNSRNNASHFILSEDYKTSAVVQGQTVTIAEMKKKIFALILNEIRTTALIDELKDYYTPSAEDIVQAVGDILLQSSSSIIQAPDDTVIKNANRYFKHTLRVLGKKSLRELFSRPAATS